MQYNDVVPVFLNNDFVFNWEGEVPLEKRLFIWENKVVEIAEIKFDKNGCKIIINVVGFTFPPGNVIEDQKY